MTFDLYSDQIVITFVGIKRCTFSVRYSRLGHYILQFVFFKAMAKTEAGRGNNYDHYNSLI